MPVTPTYPGVYIEEIPSGVRTLTGVATSITAFLGRARRGPVNAPITIFSYADFEREFGGLWVESDLSYAVRDFFINGGGQAIIVRLQGAGAVTAASDLDATGMLTLSAANFGVWGNYLQAWVDYDIDTETIPDEEQANFFNLTLKDTATNNEEVFRNVVVSDTYQKHARYLPAVLANGSKLASLAVTTPLSVGSRPAIPPGDPLADPPVPPCYVLTGGADGVEPDEIDYLGSAGDKTGLYALENADLFNLLCIPDMLTIGGGLTAAANSYCLKRRAMLLIDSPESWNSAAKVLEAGTGIEIAPVSENAAIFYPRLMQPDPLRDNQLVSRPSCGAVAGVIARTDATRGIWKAPAGLDATLNGVPKLSVPLTDNENGQLNPLGVNCLRTRPAAGRVIWGARTRKGDDRLSSEWKYIPVRRLALYIEESLYRGTQWVVFEPNDEPLWAQIRLNVGAFMNGLFRKGAFQGSSPADAYFVKCDKETTTQADINLGIVNIIVGFAPLKPAEFVIIKLQQIAGQVAA